MKRPEIKSWGLLSDYLLFVECAQFLFSRCNFRLTGRILRWLILYESCKFIIRRSLELHNSNTEIHHHRHPHPITRQLTVCQVEDHVMTLEKALDLVIVPFAYAKLEWTRVGWRVMGPGISLYQVKEDFFQLRLVRLSPGFCQDAFHEIFRSFIDYIRFSEFLFLEVGQNDEDYTLIQWAHRCVTLLQ